MSAVDDAYTDGWNDAYDAFRAEVGEEFDRLRTGLTSMIVNLKGSSLEHELIGKELQKLLDNELDNEGEQEC